MDLSQVLAHSGVIAAWSMQDLRADGVKHIRFRRFSSAPTARPWLRRRARRSPKARCSTSASRWRRSLPRRAQAEDAAELAGLEHEELPCVVDPRKAVEPGAPLLWEQASGNVAAEAAYGNKEALKSLLRSRARYSHRTAQPAAECDGARAALRDRGARGRAATLYTQCQTPTAARELLGAAFGEPPASFRLLNGDIGGGFGMKPASRRRTRSCATPRASSAAR